MKHINFATEFKSLDDSGTFEGYAAVFGNEDLGGDVLEKGAFKEIALRRNGRVVILNQHRQGDPIGLADVKEDDHGLWFKGEIVLASESGRSAHSLMKAGVLDGMSFGYDVLPNGAEMKDGRRHLKAVKLWEISPVTFGMNPLAGVDSVKALAESGRLPTMTEFQKHLRQAGFSKTEAVAVANHGLSKLLRSQSGDEQAAINAVSQALANLRS